MQELQLLEELSMQFKQVTSQLKPNYTKEYKILVITKILVDHATKLFYPGKVTTLIFLKKKILISK